MAYDKDDSKKETKGDSKSGKADMGAPSNDQQESAEGNPSPHFKSMTDQIKKAN